MKLSFTPFYAELRPITAPATATNPREDKIGGAVGLEFEEGSVAVTVYDVKKTGKADESFGDINARLALVTEPKQAGEPGGPFTFIVGFGVSHKFGHEFPASANGSAEISVPVSSMVRFSSSIQVNTNYINQQNNGVVSATISANF